VGWQVKTLSGPLAVLAGARYRDGKQRREARVMSSFWGFIAWIIRLYITAVAVHVIFGWLLALGAINRRNQTVYMIADTLNRLVEPALRPIRRRLPDFGGIDLSPLVLILILLFIADLVSGASIWDFIARLIGIYITILLIHLVLSWLIMLDVINRRNPVVYMISDAFRSLTEPALRPIRSRLPDFGGLDISPLILILFLLFITDFVIYWLRVHVRI
jgi:YggT family protein